MDNQHRLIKGYAELSEEQIALMNEITELGKLIENTCNKVEGLIVRQYDACKTYDGEPETKAVPKQAEQARLMAAEPLKWHRSARDAFQADLMYLKRAVAQPTFF